MLICDDQIVRVVRHDTSPGSHVSLRKKSLFLVDNIIVDLIIRGHTSSSKVFFFFFKRVTEVIPLIKVSVPDDSLCPKDLEDNLKLPL
jgi:hypothetical protein